MKKELLRIFLADDDDDDCALFQDALDDLDHKTELIVSKDGEELMSTFEEKVPPPPYVLFLDLNMPRKSRFECLKEMKQNEKLKFIPIVVFSTSVDRGYIEKTFHEGAHYYARKPGSFDHLKKLIDQVLSINFLDDAPRKLETFLLTP